MAKARERRAQMVDLRNRLGYSNHAIAVRLGVSSLYVLKALSAERQRGVVVERDPYMTNRSRAA